MSRKMKKLLKDVEARTIPYVIIALLVGVAITSLFLVPQSPLSMNPVSAAVVGDYLHNKKITIDHTEVDGTLTNFPAWVYNTSSSFADNILTNGADIAFFDSTNTTRFNHEIELWDKGTGELGVWVNVTSISSSADTGIYMYYGDSDTADSRNHNPESVWDTNFVGVYHMNGSAYGSCIDSTSYGNDIEGQSGNPTFEQTGKTGYCVDFDGDGDRLDCGDSAQWDNMVSTQTIECWFNGEAPPEDPGIGYMVFRAAKDRKSVG